MHNPEDRINKRILFVVHSLIMGGTERLVLQMALALKDDFEVAICCLDEAGVLAQHALSAKIQIICLDRKAGMSFSTINSFAKLLKTFKPDIIHAHQYTPFFYAAMAKIITLAKAKLIFTEHGRHYPDEVSLKRRLINQCLLLFTNHITAVSEFTKNSLRDIEWMRSKAILIIYNGIKESVNDATKSIRKELNIPDHLKIIGYVGGLRPIKNPLFLLRAFKRVSAAYEDAVLVYIGDGPLEESVRLFAKEYGLDKKVYLAGLRDPVEPYFSNLDIFVLPSLSEATSLALLEAMARKVSVIVTDRGGSPEIVRQGETGYVIKCDDDKGLSDSILRLLTDNAQSKRLSSKAQRDVSEKYSFDGMMQKYINLYKD